MAVEALDHINIRTDDVPATVAFFRDILDLAVGPAPGTTSVDRGAWLRDKLGHPVVHIGTAAATYPTDHSPAFCMNATGPIHHVAFTCTDYDGMYRRIEALGHEVLENDVASIGLRQMFVQAPGGVMLELNFWNGEPMT
jgi:catechol 2,3-dioxygenase-like lactoylglutathione lyase family enzyme